MNRRALLSLLPLAPLATIAAPKPEAPAQIDPTTCDARVWAKHFVEWMKQVPSIATDEETMASWFASTITAGYNARGRELEASIKAMTDDDLISSRLLESYNPFNPRADYLSEAAKKSLGVA